MLIQYCSDLHLEFPENREFLLKKPLVPKASILLLAGDIVPFASLSAQDGFFDHLSKSFQRTYWIPGNHEYYGSDIRRRSGSFQENIRENVILTNNTVIEEGEVRLILSSLWTNITPRFEKEIQQSLHDFHVIHHGTRKLRAAHVNALHVQSLDFIKGELARPTEKKTMIVTHHVPTYFHYPEVYKDSPLNEAFAVELFPLIRDAAVSHWIYGHHHFNRNDFQIGGTTLTTNQLGYVHKNENRGFRPDKTIEI